MFIVSNILLCRHYISNIYICIDNEIDELRQFTHLKTCMCYFCQFQDHKEAIEEDMWESMYITYSIYIKMLYIYIYIGTRLRLVCYDDLECCTAIPY